tara:strand:- start:683 stop:1354 length:672 start_codon:yes stop_codon:yes gene_type:complete
MEWNKPYHSESGKTQSHGPIIGQSFNTKASTVETKKSESFLSRLKKPFMPTTWRWFRTSGSPKVYEYQPRLGETTKLNLNLPRQFWPVLVDSTGTPFQTTGNTIAIEMDDSDYLEMGSRQTVPMEDADNPEQIKSVTFPTLRFTQEGKLYQLDWNKFARERKVAYGAYDEDWGYARAGQPTYGDASMYDKSLDLIWNNKFQWWWILLGLLGFFGLVKWIQRRQ